MRNFKGFMNETKAMNRWFIAAVFIAGMFCGAVLTTVWLLPAITAIIR